MNLTIPAVYENGIFRPVAPVPELAEGTPVVITIQNPKPPESEASNQSLSPKEFREFIRSRNPDSDMGSEEEWEELDRLLQLSLSNVRDPEAMRRAAERMDRLSEEIYKREGLLDFAVPYLREARDEE